MPMSFWVIGSSKRRPISRLIAKYVNSGLVTACRLAACPTRRSPSALKATIDGVVRPPSEFSMTLGVEPSMTATQEFVVPRSMPITFAISVVLPLGGGFLASYASAFRPVPIDIIGKTGGGRKSCRSQGVYRGGVPCLQDIVNLPSRRVFKDFLVIVHPARLDASRQLPV